MSGLIISEAVQYGIKNTTHTKKINKSSKYKQLIKEADEMIRKDNLRYAEAIRKSQFFRALESEEFNGSD